MRRFYLVGAALVAFATGFIAEGLDRLEPGFFNNQPQVHVASTKVVSSTRLLRTESVVNSAGEERAGGGISLPAAEKFALFFKSSEVTDEELQKLLIKGKSAESLFIRMEFRNSFTFLFDNDQFSKWVTYADDLSATASGKGTSAIATLTREFGDEDLYIMIEYAKRESRQKELAIRLEADQLQRWKSIAKDPGEVYELYDLQFAGKRLLRQEKFSEWAKYVDDLNVKNEGAVSMIPTLRKHYIKDEILFDMIETAKRTSTTKPMGEKLEDAFTQFWINNKETPDNVLVELGLQQSTETLLENPLLSFLTKYLDEYNGVFNDKKTTMIEVLTRAFDDDQVTRMIIAGKEKHTTKGIANELEAAQLEMWLSSGRSVDKVYDLLKLPARDDVYHFGVKPLFNTWVSFMDAFSIKNPGEVAAFFLKMTTEFKERPMMQILEAAKKFPSMEGVASKLQMKKAEEIFAKGFPPHKAFTMLALDDVGDIVLSSPVFNKWMEYVDDFNKVLPRKERESWFLPLRAYYQGNHLERVIETARKTPKTAKIGDMVEKAQTDKWLARKRLPMATFRDYDLYSTGEKTLSSPKFELWVKYLDDFNKRYPKEKVTMIDSIRESYRDINLVDILDAAKKDPNTKKLALELQDALLDKWIKEKQTVPYLENWIGYKPTYPEWLELYTKKLNSVSA